MMSVLGAYSLKRLLFYIKIYLVHKQHQPHKNIKIQHNNITDLIFSDLRDLFSFISAIVGFAKLAICREI